MAPTSASPTTASSQRTAREPGTTPSTRCSRLAPETARLASQLLAALDRSLDLRGGIDRGRQPLSAPNRQFQAVLRHQPEALALQPHLGGRQLLAAAQRRPLLIERKAVIEELQGGGVPLGLAGGAEHRRDQGDAVAGRGGDEHVAGAQGVAGLDPVDIGNRAHEVVAVDHLAGLRAAAQGGLGAVEDLAEERVAAQLDREVDEVAGAGEVAGLVEADGVGVGGVLETEPRRRLVHPRDEPRLAARRRLRQRRSRIVARGEQQPVEQVAYLDPLALDQPQQRLRRARGVDGRDHHLGELEPAAGDVGGHQLGGRGDRERARLAVRRQRLRVDRVDQHPGARPELGRGWELGGGNAIGAPEECQQRQRQDYGSPASALHPSIRRSTQLPGWISCGSRFGLSSVI